MGIHHCECKLNKIGEKKSRKNFKTEEEKEKNVGSEQIQGVSLNDKE